MLEDELSSNEDEWYFDSIQRYKRLSMFELQKTPFQLSFTDPRSICVLSACNEAQSEITELSLPIKPLSENSLISSSDLKFKCGTFTNSVVSQVKVLYKNNKVVSSEEGQNGAVVYQLDSQSGQIKKINHLENSLLNPYLELNYANESQILLSKDTKSNSFIIDINNGSTCTTINTVDDCLPVNDLLVPLFVRFNNVSFLNKRTGSIKFFDIRTSTSCSQTKICSSLNHGTLWTYSSDFFRPFLNGSEISSMNPTSSRIFLLSNNGDLIVYDSRNLNKCVADYNLNLKTRSDSYIELNCCPSDEDVVSVSGFDGNIYVFKVESDIEKLFTHDGHCHVENCDKETVVTSHVWMDCSNGISIASCAFNKTLHLWTFL